MKSLFVLEQYIFFGAYYEVGDKKKEEEWNRIFNAIFYIYFCLSHMLLNNKKFILSNIPS